MLGVARCKPVIYMFVLVCVSHSVWQSLSKRSVNSIPYIVHSVRLILQSCNYIIEWVCFTFNRVVVWMFGSFARSIFIQCSELSCFPSMGGYVVCFPCFVKVKYMSKHLLKIAPRCTLPPLWWTMNQSIAGPLSAFIIHYHLDQAYHFSLSQCSLFMFNNCLSL